MQIPYCVVNCAVESPVWLTDNRICRTDLSVSKSGIDKEPAVEETKEEGTRKESVVEEGTGKRPEISAWRRSKTWNGCDSCQTAVKGSNSSASQLLQYSKAS